MTTITTPSELCVRYTSRPVAQLFGAAVVIGLIGFVLWLIPPEEGRRILLAVLVAVALFSLNFIDTRFSTTSPYVVRRWRILGLIPIWRRRYPKARRATPLSGARKPRCAGRRSANYSPRSSGCSASDRSRSCR